MRNSVIVYASIAIAILVGRAIDPVRIDDTLLTWVLIWPAVALAMKTALDWVDTQR